jgi:hypothetical protein
MSENERRFLNEMYSAVLERTIRRLWILCIILVVLLVSSNLAWIYYENQFEEIEIIQDSSDGNNNFIGKDGNIYNGITNNQNSQEKE